MASISLTPDVSHAGCEVEYQTLFHSAQHAAASNPAGLVVTKISNSKQLTLAKQQQLFRTTPTRYVTRLGIHLSHQSSWTFPNSCKNPQCSLPPKQSALSCSSIGPREAPSSVLLPVCCMASVTCRLLEVDRPWLKAYNQFRPRLFTSNWIALSYNVVTTLCQQEHRIHDWSKSECHPGTNQHRVTSCSPPQHAAILLQDILPKLHLILRGTQSASIKHNPSVPKPRRRTAHSTRRAGSVWCSLSWPRAPPCRG